MENNKHNESEAYPFHEKVIIKHLPVEETLGGEGLIHKSEMQLDREAAIQVKSQIVAIGELAFDNLDLLAPKNTVVVSVKVSRISVEEEEEAEEAETAETAETAEEPAGKSE